MPYFSERERAKRASYIRGKEKQYNGQSFLPDAKGVVICRLSELWSENKVQISLAHTTRERTSLSQLRKVESGKESNEEFAPRIRGY